MKNIYITIDTECHDINSENKYIWGKLKNDNCGIEYIAECGNRFGIHLNFFFDMCESYRYGEEYAENIIDVIRSYGHSVYLHLHPNYISGDDSRSFLWQYSREEQKEILSKAFSQYNDFMGTDACLAFRAGRYGASPDMYECLEELGINTVDLSYCHNNYKMCHLTEKDVNTVNVPVLYKSQVLLPNTRFVCFDFLGKKKSINTDIHEATFGEIKRVLEDSELKDIVFTMHSWHFIDKAFYRKSIRKDKRQVKKFEKIIKYCKSRGYQFCDVGSVDFSDRLATGRESDKEINLCRGFFGKIRSLVSNFFRFAEIAKLNKKYFLIYSVFYSLLALGAVAIILLVLL